MSIITTDDVRRLANLSSLDLSDEEAGHLQADLENILEYFNQLKELDTTGVEPTYQVNGLDNVWRDDVVDVSVDTESLVSLAPERDGTSVKVPQVL